MSLIHLQQRPGPLSPGLMSGPLWILTGSFLCSGNTYKRISIMFSCLSKCRVCMCVCVCVDTVLGSSSCTLSWRAARSERASVTAASRSNASWGGRQTDALMSVWLFVYDLNVQLKKPEALAIVLFFLWIQGLCDNSSSPDIKLGSGLWNNI